MLLTGEGPLTCDWQPLWRRAGLCEGQLSRSPHSHWSRVTHTRQAKHLSLSFLAFLFSFTYSFYAFRRCFPKSPTLVLLPSPRYLGFFSFSLVTFLLIYFYFTFSPYSSHPRPLLRHASLSFSESIFVSHSYFYFLWPLLHFSSRTHG